MSKTSVLDLLEDSEDTPDFFQNGHSFESNGATFEANGASNGRNGFSPEKIHNFSLDENVDEKNSSKGSINSNDSEERKAKRVELKSLLGNSLGSYWNDGSMMVDKRRRKQVIRYTTEDDKKENEDNEDQDKITRTKRKQTPTSVFAEKSDKVNLKKRARPQRTQTGVSEEIENDSFKLEDSYYKLFETGSVLNSTMESTFTEDDEEISGSRRRKRFKPYTKSPYSIACQIALKPVRNFNMCTYKQPSMLLQECSNFLIRDHSAVPLTLALDATELIHVSQYKVLMQNKKHVKRKVPHCSKSKADLDSRRPGYSRQKEELKAFLCKVTVERNIQSQQRRSGQNKEYNDKKQKLIEFLNNYKKS